MGPTNPLPMLAMEKMAKGRDLYPCLHRTCNMWQAEIYLHNKSVHCLKKSLPFVFAGLLLFTQDSCFFVLVSTFLSTCHKRGEQPTKGKF